MLQRFFSRNPKLPDDDDLKLNSNSPPPDEDEHKDEDEQPPILLLVGPPSCGKSSLLFQFAFNSAIHSPTTSTVVFLCNRRKLETNPPFLSQGIDPDSQVFQRIEMKYVDDDEGINKYFAGFHLHCSFPALVVIDDFADFFDQRNWQGNPRGRELAMVGVLALCQNALTHAKEVGWPCTLLLSDTQHGDSPRFLYIYKRWVSSIYTIQGDGSGSSSSFLVKNTYRGCGSAGPVSGRSAKYSIAFQYLVLEGIEEDE